MIKRPELSNLSAEAAPTAMEPPPHWRLSVGFRRWINRLNVGQQISIGYLMSLGIAIGGTSIGVGIGNAYQNHARMLIEDALEETRLIHLLQMNVAHAQVAQLQFVGLLEQPQRLQDQHSRFLRHLGTAQETWSELTDSYEEPEVEETEDEMVVFESILSQHDRLLEQYSQQTQVLWEQIDPSKARSEEIEEALLRLLEFNRSPISIELQIFLEKLEKLTEVLLEEELEAEVILNEAGPLQKKIIAISVILSVAIATLLAIFTSREISHPIQALTRVVRRTTDESNFDLQASVNSTDEVEILATSFNKLIRRVKQLLVAQKERTTQLQETLEQLKITQTQMIAQEKLASLGTLTAGIAHEIRNPLNFVNNFSELSIELIQELSEELEGQKSRLEPEAIAYFEEILSDLESNAKKIHHHGNRAESIVQNMLLHSRGGKGQWTQSDLNAILEEAVNLAYHGMRAKDPSFNVTFAKDYDETINPIVIVPQAISRVFLNIISNGCYAVRDKQQKLGESFSPKIDLTTRNLGEKVEIRIRDNGLGMSSEVREKIFNHFFTTKPTGEGTGLGLSLSYEIIVKQHQGQLDVISEPGSYAEFTIVLPNQVDKHGGK
jgi:signal transduction histidine kinase